MIDSLFEIIESIWPLLAALYAGLHGLITWLFKRKKKGDSDQTELEESPDQAEKATKARQLATEATQQLTAALQQTANPQEPKSESEQKPAPPEKQKPARVKPSEPTPKPVPAPHPVLTAQNIRQAIIVSEILGKPKSLRSD